MSFLLILESDKYIDLSLEIGAGNECYGIPARTRVCTLHILKPEILGAGNETRTRDPNLGKVVLYQLSYSRVA